MLIDIPVSIAFDCESPQRLGRHDRETRVFTMRYDTRDTDRSAQWCLQYPPPANPQWITDEQGVLFDLLTSAADKSITSRAERDPETYCADPAEGKALAEKIAQEAAANSQFGVGA